MQRQESTKLIALNVAALLACMYPGGGSYAWAAPPLLYHQPAHESPVRGAPDDLLLIAGYGLSEGDRVVYEAVSGAAGEPLRHPSDAPRESTERLGVAGVVSADVPYALTIRLPTVMIAGQPYALWVLTAKGEWSESVRINDARPLWFSPPYVYSTGSVASLSRYIKVVGRNLEPTPGLGTEVRLLGKTQIVLEAEPATVDGALDHYVARAALPARIAPGEYRVQVRRDRSGWIDVPGQLLLVRPDMTHVPEFNVSEARYGGCKPDDGLDDAGCVLRAVAAAAANGGGTVVFGPGTWNLSERTMTQPSGIAVPRGVNLRGAGQLATTIVQEADGQPSPVKTTFTLLGKNIVAGLTFRDAHLYSPEYVNSATLRLGTTLGEGTPGAIQTASDIVITQNIFDRPNVAISDSGAPITRLFVTDNEFGAYRSALELAGDRFRVNDKFAVEDSVIADNMFKPGSYIDTAIRQGSMASEIGAGLRVDFSHNTADGAAADRLYSPDDAHGWRAAFFWHMNNNQEMLLVSQNTATCTGDKAGDGEAIAYDDNANTFPFPGAATVLRATPGSVTVAGPLATRQNDREIRIDNYYEGHWIQVGEGPGLGQVRKVRSYTQDAPNTTTFQVAPDWDVVPAAGRTRINVGREFWQVYTVANTIDNRRPLCQKSNRSGPHAGVIAMWAQTADSAIEGNRQYDSDGIIFRQHYDAEDNSCAVCNRETSYVDYLEIRGNLIEGEYAWDDGCSSSGIFGSLAAGPTPHSLPPTVTFGLSISHNVIDRADGRRGGAISLMPTWFEGPPPGRWLFVDNALIYHNTLRGLNAAPARPCDRDAAHARTAISLDASGLLSRGVLYGNSCPDAQRAIDIGASPIERICAPNVETSCGCPPR